ncbi:MAG: transcription antitermination factor NusB [Candidatus Cloacimonetes bacterium]|nr:transcription antitermination factor NusB [Candidatus Cloacimonadota bacterium]
MGIRRKSRELAFKVLYSLEYTAEDETLGHLKWLELCQEKLEDVLEEFEKRQDERIIEFADYLIRNTILNMEEIDGIIDNHSSNWSIERLAVTDKSLLRIAVFEMLKTETPSVIVMDEAIEIAKRYCSESSSKFINGVLNSISEIKK